jgi:hypothetical protein
MMFAQQQRDFVAGGLLAELFESGSIDDHHSIRIALRTTKGNYRAYLRIILFFFFSLFVYVNCDPKHNDIVARNFPATFVNRIVLYSIGHTAGR